MAMLEDLTPRQFEVLQLISKGVTNKEVSSLMHISIHTVKAHIASILRSFEVSNRTEAVFTYRQLQESAAPTLTNKTDTNKCAAAVLPFLNLSEDARHAHLGESIAEELSTRIACIRNLPVIAFSSCRNYNSADSLSDVAQKVGALYIVTGSVQWIESTLRVNVAVQNVNQSTALWSEIYQHPVDEIFATLGTITTAIASTLNVQLIDNQAQQPNAANGKAWNKTMLGMNILHQHNHTRYPIALEYFNDAIKISPEWALPYAGRAHTYYKQWFEQLCESPDAQLDLIERDSLKAIELDPQLATGHMVHALLQIARGRGSVAVESLKLAISLNPSLAPAHSLLGQICCMIGDDTNALKHLNYALELNPRDPHRWSYYAALSLAHLAQQRYSEAIACAGEALAFSAQSSLPYIALIIAHLNLGNYDVAEQNKLALYEKNPHFCLAHLQDIFANAEPEMVKPIFKLLREFGMD